MYISIKTATLYQAADEEGYGIESPVADSAAFNCVAIKPPRLALSRYYRALDQTPL